MHLLLYGIVPDCLYCIVYYSLPSQTLHSFCCFCCIVCFLSLLYTSFFLQLLLHSSCHFLRVLLLHSSCICLLHSSCILLFPFFLLHSSVVAFFLPTLLLHSSCYFCSIRTVCCSHSSAKFHVAITRTACRNPGFQAQWIRFSISRSKTIVVGSCSGHVCFRAFIFPRQSITFRFSFKVSRTCRLWSFLLTNFVSIAGQSFLFPTRTSAIPFWYALAGRNAHLVCDLRRFSDLLNGICFWSRQLLKLMCFCRGSSCRRLLLLLLLCVWTLIEFLKSEREIVRDYGFVLKCRIFSRVRESCVLKLRAEENWNCRSVDERQRQREEVVLLLIVLGERERESFASDRLGRRWNHPAQSIIVKVYRTRSSPRCCCCYRQWRSRALVHLCAGNGGTRRRTWACGASFAVARDCDRWMRCVAWEVGRGCSARFTAWT